MLCWRWAEERKFPTRNNENMKLGSFRVTQKSRAKLVLKVSRTDNAKDFECLMQNFDKNSRPLISCWSLTLACKIATVEPNLIQQLVRHKFHVDSWTFCLGSVIALITNPYAATGGVKSKVSFRLSLARIALSWSIIDTLSPVFLPRSSHKLMHFTIITV